MVGIGGPYDVRQVEPLLRPLVGPSLVSDPDAWRAADPFALATAPPDGLAVLLLHGTSDAVVPAAPGRHLAAVLRRAGTDVTALDLPGADHGAEYRDEVAGPVLLRWFRERWPARTAEGTGAA
jgi:alpha-beta hydrolase superfamily lysophospholipase